MLNDPKYKNVSPHYPAFTISTGVYDFYQKNPFTIANHHAVLGGQMLALIMDKTKLWNNDTPSLCGYSLGSVFVFSTLCTLYDLGCEGVIGDAVLMGSCVDVLSLGLNIHKLVGSRGSVQGKLTILYTKYDSVLKYLFRSVRLGESPTGLFKISYDFLANCLRNSDPAFSTATKEELMNYLYLKVDNIDVSDWCNSHFAFKYRCTQIMPHIEFNSDLKYFKEKS